MTRTDFALSYLRFYLSLITPQNVTIGDDRFKSSPRMLHAYIFYEKLNHMLPTKSVKDKQLRVSQQHAAQQKSKRDKGRSHDHTNALQQPVTICDQNHMT